MFQSRGNRVNELNKLLDVKFSSISYWIRFFFFFTKCLMSNSKLKTKSSCWYHLKPGKIRLNLITWKCKYDKIIVLNTVKSRRYITSKFISFIGCNFELYSIFTCHLKSLKCLIFLKSISKQSFAGSSQPCGKMRLSF